MMEEIIREVYEMLGIKKEENDINSVTNDTDYLEDDFWFRVAD